MKERVTISKRALERLVHYLNHLKTCPKDGNVSSTMIAEAMGLNPVLVRKDLALVASGGKPKTGYLTRELIADIRLFLGYDNVSHAILVGAGNMGKALLSYQSFEKSGLSIMMAFDAAPTLIDTEIGGKKVVDIAKMPTLVRRLGIRIAILTVPAESAQAICDVLVAAGVRAVWNFAPVSLSVPENVVVKNENIAASFTVLSRMLTENIERYGLDE